MNSSFMSTMSMSIGFSGHVNLSPSPQFHTRTTTLALTTTTTNITTTTGRRKKEIISIQHNNKINSSKGKFYCLFSSFNNNNNSRKQEDARKALEGALGGKQNEFHKWDQEIKKREEQQQLAGGSGNSGGGRGWFPWRGDDHFWQETQQTSLAVLAIILIYLVIAKGQVLLAVVFNLLLFALHGTRNAFTSIMSPPLPHTKTPTTAAHTEIATSAKERVVNKWASAD